MINLLKKFLVYLYKSKQLTSLNLSLVFTSLKLSFLSIRINNLYFHSRFIVLEIFIWLSLVSWYSIIASKFISINEN